ncbi:hypothetical protein [Adhaeribacter pallidiroseus]|uniref:Uncharacterized protein n=1 Tax=Adhaeribacter pallidiroseus TaxID=2072847 RepID=A0A369QS55_9BACT|nr:hypothetical protein [Adhaeribacter pallidiroseus]RDC65008.1 hypothetical protein AHMF7616_03630 [Adhaeribacter pallidiroseus]
MLLLLTLIIAFALQFFLPWWIVAPVSFGLAAWRGRNGWAAFGTGFLGIGLGWLLLSAFIHFRTAGILTNKVGQLFSLPNPTLLLLITALIGGVVGGFSAWAGYCCRRLF